MMNSTTDLPTQNETWGFYGSMGGHSAAAWPLAFAAIAKATDADPDAVRAFLDSRHGRHFADTVVDRMASGASVAGAIDSAVATWLGWTIGRQTSRQYGIPRGIPYLTGFVLQSGIELEAA